MKYLCIHGHFYQPPRENPWLEAIELQDSAYPYHDWNERITAESYAPNAATRILDDAGRINRIVNNYSLISFNVGPTLLSWAKDKAPGLHEMILQADKESQGRFSGHGSAIAQAYNHIIMPLASSRDKRTQVVWGIEDFRSRFGRDPEGMWLPETAVDLETLDLMAEYGIKFTILAQYQAKLVRRIGRTDWVDVTGGRIDPTRAYQISLPSGRKMSLFFYDGPISRAVAFEGLLNNGEVFAQRLLTAYSSTRDWPELAHIATDGESYGHHHRHGEMALSYALRHIEDQGWARLTNYGEFLEKFPPTHEVEIYENTAWSCAHGVGRWQADCGCNSGGHPGWNQSWRGPLRDALNWLRDTMAVKYEQLIGQYLRDPWSARDEYIKIVLDRTPANRSAFLAKHSIRTLRPYEQVDVWKLLELQRHAMLMYTSCGWFFDEISGIETVQVIQYAGRVLQLARELFNSSEDEPLFLEKLAQAKSNVPEHGDGAQIYERSVRPAVVDLRKVAAHYAITSVFHQYGDRERIYCYTAERQDFQTADAGRMRMAVGKALFTSEVTQEQGVLMFGVLHFGDHNVHAGIRAYESELEYLLLLEQTSEAFSRADIPQVIRAFDRGFGHETYSVRSLFRDEQRNILSLILTSTLAEAEAAYRQLYEHHVPLMRFLGDLKTPLPKAFQTTAEYALNSHLRHAFSQEVIETDRIRKLIAEARLAGIDFDHTTLEFTLRRSVERMSERFREDPYDLNNLRALRNAMALQPMLPFTLTLWTVQNVCWDIWREMSKEMLERSREQHSESVEWLKQFRALAVSLSLRLD